MRSRAGYTLLEVLLAVAIGLLLVAALYVALDVQMRYMRAGRQIVAEAQLARGVLNRIATDVRSQLALLPTAASLAAVQQEAGSQANSATGSSDGAESAEQAEDPSLAMQVNLGLQGDEFSLILVTNASPRYSMFESQAQLGYCDQRRVSYYFQPGVGLMREESRAVLSTNLGEGDAIPELIAAEVMELHFRYFDPASGGWVSQWDGSYQGPPLAIEITMLLQPPLETMTDRYVNRQPTLHRLVVSVPTASMLPAPGTSPQTTSEAMGGNP